MNRPKDRALSQRAKRIREGRELQRKEAEARAQTLASRQRQARRNAEIADAKLHPGRGCDRTTPRCPEARLMALDTPDCCKRWIREILANVAEKLDREEIRWWIDYGTLLGYVRHGGLIPWDKDCDLGIHADDIPKLKSLQAEWLAEGYHATWAPPRPAERFRTGERMKVRLSQRNWTNTDIFCWHERPGGIMDRKNYIGADLYKGREFPIKWLFPLERGEWDGIDVSVPRNAVALTEHRYGPGWRKPERLKHPVEVRR